MTRVHAHEVPAAAQFFTFKCEIEMPLLISPVRIAVRNPVAAIPDHHGPAAILALRYGTFECVVFDRVVLDVNGQALLSRHQARAFGNRPAFHHAIELEPEVVMQPPRRMLLNDEAVALPPRRMPARLRSDVEFAFLAIDLQSHNDRLPGASAHLAQTALSISRACGSATENSTCTRRVLRPHPRAVKSPAQRGGKTPHREAQFR